MRVDGPVEGLATEVRGMYRMLDRSRDHRGGRSIWVG
jgi:hypothetical protein